MASGEKYNETKTNEDWTNFNQAIIVLGSFYLKKDGEKLVREQYQIEFEVIVSVCANHYLKSKSLVESSFRSVFYLINFIKSHWQQNLPALYCRSVYVPDCS